MSAREWGCPEMRAPLWDKLFDFRLTCALLQTIGPSISKAMAEDHRSIGEQFWEPLPEYSVQSELDADEWDAEFRKGLR